MATVYIPGAASLGYGFDIYGTYSDASKTRPLFNMVYDGRQSQTYKDYLVPLNVNLDTSSTHNADSTYVENRQKIEQYFSSKVSGKVKYGFFGGQFSASYSMANKTDISYQFGILQSFSRQYAMDLQDRSERALAQWVKDDPDYKNVPNRFTDRDRILFFRFFDKYGLYYMPRVLVGARLFYSSMVRKEYRYSDIDAQAKLKAEFDAVFVSTSVSAEAKWKEVGQTWASRREVKVEAVGGSNQILGGLLPGYGTNEELAYKSWLKSAEENPAVIDFDLKPIADIFSADKAAAVQEASEAYVLHKLFLESKTGSCLIALNGQPVLPTPVSDQRVLGWQIAAISRSDLKKAFVQSYATQDFWDYEKIYGTMLQDIQPYNNSNYIIAFTAFSNFAQNAPTEPFVQFLYNCGAGEGVDQWLNTKKANLNNGCCALAHINYVFVGTPGSAKGTRHENFQRAGSCDTGAYPWYFGDYWLDKPAPLASLMVDLYHVQGPSDAELVLEIGKARRG